MARPDPTNGYCTLAELCTFARVSGTADDDMLVAAINAVSRWIDEYTGRRFWKDGADTTRYYTAEFADLLFIDDLSAALTALYTDEDGDRTYERTWAATDYDLQPDNAAADGKPYTQIATTPDGNYSFPSGAKGVKITGKFGWPSVPTMIKQATLTQAERVFKRRDAPFGVVGSAEMGQIAVVPKLDPDVQAMIVPFIRALVGMI